MKKKFKLGKKGMEQNYILGGIIFLISFGILVYWLVNILVPMVYENNERAACRTSVDINAKRITDPLVGAQIVGGLIDVNCKTIEKEIKGDTREEVFGQLADLMAMAWEDVRRGKKKIFDDDTAVFCMPRYAPIKFEEKNKVYPNFYAYLANEKYVGGQETYAEFLMNRDLTQEEYQKFTGNIDYINSNVDYAIIFTLAKQSAMDAFLGTFWGVTVGVVVGAVAVAAIVITAGAATPAVAVVTPNVIILVAGTATSIGAWSAAGIVAGTAIAGGAAGYGVNWFTSDNVNEILKDDLTSTYNIGSVSGDNYAAQLYLIPYDMIAKLDCDKLKLKRVI